MVEPADQWLLLPGDVVRAVMEPEIDEDFEVVLYAAEICVEDADEASRVARPFAGPCSACG